MNHIFWQDHFNLSEWCSSWKVHSNSMWFCNYYAVWNLLPFGKFL